MKNNWSGLWWADTFNRWHDQTGTSHIIGTQHNPYGPPIASPICGAKNAFGGCEPLPRSTPCRNCCRIAKLDPATKPDSLF